MEIIQEYFDDAGCEQGMGYIVLCVSGGTGNYIIARGPKDPMGNNRRMLCSKIDVERPMDIQIEDYCEKNGPGILLESQDIYFSESSLMQWYEAHCKDKYVQGEVLRLLSLLNFNEIITGPHHWKLLYEPPIQHIPFFRVNNYNKLLIGTKGYVFVSFRLSHNSYIGT